MCINKSNFFTRSHTVWERRRSLTLLALPAFPGRRGPGSSEVRSPLRGGSPDPARSSSGAGPSFAVPQGWGWAWGSCSPRTRGFGGIYFPTRFLFTWGLGVLGDFFVGWLGVLFLLCWWGIFVVVVVF